MQIHQFSISISYHAYLQHYNGMAVNVMVLTEAGLRLQLPAAKLRQFVTHQGIQGRFRVCVDGQRLVEISRI
nr:DUF2835 family protein [Vibrio stylophorae]